MFKLLLFDMMVPIFTMGGALVGLIFFVIFLGISLTVFFSTRGKSPTKRRVWILLAMLLITFLGSAGLLAGGFFIDIAMFSNRPTRFPPRPPANANQTTLNAPSNANLQTINANKTKP